MFTAAELHCGQDGHVHQEEESVDPASLLHVVMVISSSSCVYVGRGAVCPLIGKLSLCVCGEASYGTCGIYQMDMRSQLFLVP